ncbi:MAG TPA: DUF1552 domain-containing protein [Verrucomicrobiae bacterium]|jgi:hypothetical protein|nr:DUF1552 domain-containing protein [Verrucomicrobiae bacterium]
MSRKHLSTEGPAVQSPVGFNRRHFLRGLGACVALPAFASLLPTRLLAASSAGKLAATATGAPLRAAFLYFPNGAIPGDWWPKEKGTDFALSKTLLPLEDCRQHLQILGGLDDRSAQPDEDGAGDHARANGTFLTGVRLKKSATDLHAGISIDQVLAREIGSQTRFPSLELTCETERPSGICDSGYSCAYQYNLSWSSPTTPMTAESNPRLVFERLFGAGPPGQRVENLRRRRQEQRSILDYVMQDAHDFERRLNSGDQAKLDQYLTGVRELEVRIHAAEKVGDPKDPMTPTPEGVPPTYGEHLNLMFDILTLAFQTDSTRVATLLLAHDGSNRSFSDIGVSEGHHDLSHHFNNEEKMRKVAEIDHWYVKQFASFMHKLDQVKDADGHSLLHNSMVVYGSGNADGNRHTHVNLPIILAGAGGGTLTPGRHITHPSVPASNLFLSMADRMGVRNLPRFGESTGRLSDV